MAKTTTIGREMVRDILPEKYKNFSGTLNKGAIYKILTDMAKEIPADEIVDVQYNLHQLANKVDYERGGIASVKLSDTVLPANLRKTQDDLRRQRYAIIQRKDLTSKQKSDMLIKLIGDATPVLDKTILEELNKKDNTLAFMVGSGSKGSPQALRQIVFGDLVTMDANKKPLAYPTLTAYAQGITPLEYWTASHGGRLGYIDVQKATADAGYLAKRIRQVAHRQVVTIKDCGRARPYKVATDNSNNIGTLLHNDVKGTDGTIYKANTVITDDIINNLPSKIAIRSPLTCGAKEGVCAHCAGIRETNRLGDIDDAVGLNAVNSFLEGVTQSAISSKHGGGEAVQTRKIKKGFDAIAQFIDMPETFVGGAGISSETGIVQAIRPAPQGGNYVKINNKELHTPADSPLTVKVGSNVEAGDIISDGMVDVSKVAKFKGLGAARKSFVDNFRKVLSDNRVSTLDRNLEALARGYISKVQITDPDGIQGFIAGDIADYDELEANWKIRPSAIKGRPAQARGAYLEQPVLHYSIGTKLTDSVIDDLKSSDVDTVIVSKEPPPFEPHIVKAKTFVTADKDFITSLAGENLMRTIEKKVTRGSYTDKDSVSYYPRLALGSYHGSGQDLL